MDVRLSEHFSKSTTQELVLKNRTFVPNLSQGIDGFGRPPAMAINTHICSETCQLHESETVLTELAVICNDFPFLDVSVGESKGTLLESNRRAIVCVCSRMVIVVLSRNVQWN